MALVDNPLSEPPSPSPGPLDPRLDEILHKFAELEIKFEQLGRSAKLTESLIDYVDDLKGETSSLRAIRFWSIVLAWIYMAFVSSIFVCILFYHKLVFILWGDYPQTALIVAAISSCVFLISRMLQGAFKSRSERHKEDLLPPHLRELIDAYQATKTDP